MSAILRHKPDIAPEIRWIPRSAPRLPTARDVNLAWLAAPTDDGTDALTRLALVAVERAEALQAALRAALAVARRQDAELDRLRARRRQEPAA